MKFWGGLLCVLCLFCGIAYSEPSGDKTVQDILDLQMQVEQQIASSSAIHIRLVDKAAPYGEGDWIVLEDHDARDSAGAYVTEEVFILGGKIMKAIGQVMAPSGDITIKRVSYFRSNGSLASLAEDYRTFHCFDTGPDGEEIGVSPCLISTKWYFATDGNSINKTKTVVGRDGKPLGKPNYFYDQSKFYKKAADLGYFALVQSWLSAHYDNTSKQ